MGRPRMTFTAEEEEAICQAYINGMPQREMEIYFGHGHYLLREILRKHGVKGRNHKKERMDGFTAKDTKCWSCRRSCTSLEHQCSWTRSWIPVKGWDAKETICDRHPGGMAVKSFFVKSCPLYVPDKRLTWGVDLTDELP